MTSINIQEVAHKNVILWKLMRKFDFWKVKKTYDINRKAMVMSLGRPIDEDCGHWSGPFKFDRLKFLDKKAMLTSMSSMTKSLTYGELEASSTSFQPCQVLI